MKESTADWTVRCAGCLLFVLLTLSLLYLAVKMWAWFA